MFRHDRLAMLREEQQLTQAELGALANISAKTIWRWENGDRIPQAEHLAQLARALRCSIDYLMGLVDIPRGLYSGEKLTVEEERWRRAYLRGDRGEVLELFTERVRELFRQALDQGLLALPDVDNGE